MNFDVLEYLNLRLEVSIMGYFEEIAKHFHPKLVGRIRFKYNGGDIMSQRVDDIN